MFLFFVNLLSHQYTTYCQWATSPPSRIYDVPLALASSVSSPKDEGAAWAQEKLQKSESDWQIMVPQTAGKENAGSWWVVFLSVFVGGWYWQRTLGNEHFRETGALVSCHSTPRWNVTWLLVSSNLMQQSWRKISGFRQMMRVHCDALMCRRPYTWQWIRELMYVIECWGDAFPLRSQDQVLQGNALETWALIPAWCSKHVFWK